jgi:hypothetical protein
MTLLKALRPVSLPLPSIAQIIDHRFERASPLAQDIVGGSLQAGVPAPPYSQPSGSDMRCHAPDRQRRNSIDPRQQT